MGSIRSQIYQRLSVRSKQIGIVFTLLMVLSAIGVLGYMIYRERETLFAYHWNINYSALALAGVIYSFSILQASFNWGNIMNRLAGRLSYLKHFRYFSIANAAKRLPGTIWYVASRATLYRQEGIDVKLTSMASALEYGLISLSGILATLIFSPSILATYHISPVLLAILFLTTLFFIHPRISRYFFRLLNIDDALFEMKDILIWTGSFVLQWIVGGLLLFTVINIIFPLQIQAIGYVLGSWIVVIMVTRLLIFSPSNLGITEIGLSLLLTNLMPAPIAIAAALLFRLLVTALDILFALACVWIIGSNMRLLTKKD